MFGGSPIGMKAVEPYGRNLPHDNFNMNQNPGRFMNPSGFKKVRKDEHNSHFGLSRSNSVGSYNDAHSEFSLNLNKPEYDHDHNREVANLIPSPKALSEHNLDSMSISSDF